jgi:hypothetical protein
MSITISKEEVTLKTSKLHETRVLENFNAANALFAKLHDIISSTSDSPPDVYISFCSPGLPQSEYSLKFLEDPTSRDAQSRLYAFSRTVNTLPTGYGRWSNSGAQMDFLYREIWLKNMLLPKKELTPDQEKRLSAANDYLNKTENVNKYYVFKQPYDEANIKIIALQRQNPKPDNYDELLERYTIERDKAESLWNIPVKKGPKEGGGGRFEFENAQNDRAEIQSLGWTSAKEQLKKQYEDVKKLFKNPDTATNFVPTFCQPKDFYKEGFGWNKFEFTQKDLEEYSSYDNTRWGGTVSDLFGGLFWSADTERVEERHFEAVNLSNLSISFEYARITLDRSSWFDSYLLRSNNWWWNGATKSNPAFGGPPLSDGLLPPHGDWVMIPTEAIFARNLTVKLEISDEEKTSLAEKTTAKAHGGFWVIKVKGNYESEHGSKEFKLHKSNEGLVCEQMQILGFICTLMPKSPNPDPRYLPNFIDGLYKYS